MAWTWTPHRRDEPELMDAPGLPEAEVEDAYRVLRLVNVQLGNLRTIRREFLRFVREDVADRPDVSVLDVGSGSGDIPEAIRGMLPGRLVRVLALDRDPTAVASARRRSLSVVRGDALRLPFADRSIDLVLAVKFAHHFSSPELDRLLGEMARVARRRVVVLDIHRHWLAYWGFLAWSRVFTGNRLVATTARSPSSAASPPRSCGTRRRGSSLSTGRSARTRASRSLWWGVASGRPGIRGEPGSRDLRQPPATPHRAGPGHPADSGHSGRSDSAAPTRLTRRSTPAGGRPRRGVARRPIDRP